MRARRDRSALMDNVSPLVLRRLRLFVMVAVSTQSPTLYTAEVVDNVVSLGSCARRGFAVREEMKHVVVCVSICRLTENIVVVVVRLVRRGLCVSLDSVARRLLAPLRPFLVTPPRRGRRSGHASGSLHKVTYT